MTEEQKKLNEAKYGNKEDDTIARTFRESLVGGNFYCGKNAEKYIRRFLSNSHKANNITDLEKAKDYLQRMIDYNKQIGNTNTKEVIE